MRGVFTLDTKEIEYNVEPYFDHAPRALIKLFDSNPHVYVDLGDYFKIPGNPLAEGILFIETKMTSFGFEGVTAVGVSNSSGGLFRVYLNRVRC